MNKWAVPPDVDMSGNSPTTSNTVYTCPGIVYEVVQACDANGLESSN